jgi:TonB family protein
MSGLLRLASCSAFAPAGSAFRGGPAARPAPAAPPLALLLSGGLHLLALALFLAAAARSGLEEPPQVEIRVSLRPNVLLDPPPLYVPPAGGVGQSAKGGIIKPVPPQEPSLRETLQSFFDKKGPIGAIRPDAPLAGGGGPGVAPAPGQNAVVDRDTPTDSYDQPPVPIVAPEPPYPEFPREAGIEGKVVLEALVSWEGHVREVRVREGNPMLAEPSAKVVKTWRFRPARWKGRAVTAWVSIPIVFRLQ